MSTCNFTLKRIAVYLSLWFVLFPADLLPQVLVHGYILDQKTREPLSAANIQIAGTFRGTITNEDGKFQIEVLSLPAVLMISYIGYETQPITLREFPQDVLRILLKPIILDSEPIVVIAEDPAIGIMREVIKRKKIWRDALTTYRAGAYSRLVFENDSGIVSISESISETYWDRVKGPREIITSKKQTSNMSDEQNIAFASYIPNFYDDDIDEMGFKVIGPTHPEALEYYDFRLEKISYLDAKKVFTIRVIPAGKLQPVFEGRIEVLDSTFALLAVNLKPGPSILYPWPIQEWNINYRQQFSSFGKIYWLPVDFRAEGSIRIGITGLQFPTIHYKRITGLSDYEINVELPDSLYRQKDFLSVDSVSLKDPTLFAARKEIIPLAEREEQAYQTLDSTMTLRKAFKPTGFLAKVFKVEVEGDREQVNAEGKNLLSLVSPQLWFNRVDGLHAGLEFTPFRKDKNVHLILQAAYKTALQKAGYAAGMEYRFGVKPSYRCKMLFSTTTDVRLPSDTYSRTVASVAPLLAADDYFDYYWNKSLRFESGITVPELQTEITAGFRTEHHTSLDAQSNFNLVGSDFKQRLNPSIESGNLRALDVQVRYGDAFVPFGVVGQNRAEVKIEHSSPDLFNSGFDYTRYELGIDLRLNTGLRRRLLPMALDLHLAAGTSRGTLPVQKFFAIDSRLLFLDPFGTLRSLTSRPLEGEKFAVVFVEHNFRTVLFELCNLDYLVRKSYGIILHGAAGRTWISPARLTHLPYELHYADHVHTEIGLSLNGVFNLFRFDVTQRLDRQVTYLGIGFSRFF